MKCPKCKKEMERLMYNEQSVDICLKCKLQVYFNEDELIIDKFTITKRYLGEDDE